MKQIEVVAAIIRKEDKIFATQRGHGEWKDWWENEHEAARWLAKDELESVEWLPADWEVVRRIKTIMK